jgi:UDP-glucose 4-epimerase
VADVVQANLRAAAACDVSRAYNIGSGARITINELVALIRDVSGLDPIVRMGDPRPGDVRHSLADISAAGRDFGFVPTTKMRDGLADYVEWARTEVGP